MKDVLHNITAALRALCQVETYHGGKVVRGDPATKDQLAQLEQRLGRAVSEAWRQVLEGNNGLHLDVAGDRVAFCLLSTDATWAPETQEVVALAKADIESTGETWVPALPIGLTSAHILTLLHDDGRVVEWSSHDEGRDWPSLVDYLNDKVEDLRAMRQEALEAEQAERRAQQLKASGQTIVSILAAVAVSENDLWTFCTDALYRWTIQDRGAQLLDILPSPEVRCAAWNGRLVAVGTRSGVMFWDPVAGEQCGQVSAGNVHSLGWVEDQLVFASGRELGVCGVGETSATMIPDRSASTLAVASGLVFCGNGNPPTALRFSLAHQDSREVPLSAPVQVMAADQTHVVAACTDRVVHILDHQMTLQRTLTVEGQPSEVAINKAGSQVAISEWRKKQFTTIWDLATGHLITELPSASTGPGPCRRQGGPIVLGDGWMCAARCFRPNDGLHISVLANSSGS